MSTVKYKASERYTFGWTDPRIVNTKAFVRKIITNGVSHPDRLDALKLVVRADSMDMKTTDADNNTYRISIYDDGEVYVLCFGLSLSDNDLEGHYSSVDNLPNWVQERLAILMLLSTNPPNPPVEGVGRRISSDVFWVFAPETVS